MIYKSKQQTRAALGTRAAFCFADGCPANPVARMGASVLRMFFAIA
jgi:hypothetical protein